MDTRVRAMDVRVSRPADSPVLPPLVELRQILWDALWKTRPNPATKEDVDYLDEIVTDAMNDVAAHLSARPPDSPKATVGEGLGPVHNLIDTFEDVGKHLSRKSKDYSVLMKLIKHARATLAATHPHGGKTLRPLMGTIRCPHCCKDIPPGMQYSANVGATPTTTGRTGTPEMIVCPFCSEGDFDLVGLKMHLERGWCVPYYEVLPVCGHLTGCMCTILHSMSIEHPKPHECDGKDADCPRHTARAAIEDTPTTDKAGKPLPCADSGSCTEANCYRVSCVNYRPDMRFANEGGTAEGHRRGGVGMANLIEGIQLETNRCRKLREQYMAIGLPGRLGLALIDGAIERGEKAIASDDVVQVLVAYKELKSIKG